MAQAFDSGSDDLLQIVRRRCLVRDHLQSVRFYRADIQGSWHAPGIDGVLNAVLDPLASSSPSD